MVTDDTRSTASSEPTTAARATRTPPIFSAPADSIAARLAAVVYHPQLGTVAAWDAAQWRINLAKANGDWLHSAYKAMPDGEGRNDVHDACRVNDDEYAAAIEAALEMPSPHMNALLWKLQYFLEIEADGYTASWRADGIKPLFDDVARFAASERSPTRRDSEWATARATYVVAREGEQAAGAVNDVAGEERWTTRRYEAEDALMAIPSPDASAFAFKFMVAKGGGRETDCWDEMLEREALLFAKVEG